MALRRRAAGEPPPAYGPNELLFTVQMNHGGFFCGVGSNKCYVDGRTTFFDGCEVDTWSPLWIEDFVQQLGHNPAVCSVYWLLRGMDLDNGLRIVDCDRDTFNMIMVVPKFQHFTLYVDQPHLFDHINLDDVAIVGSPPLPPVLSPKKSSKRHSTGTSPAAGAFRGVRRPRVENDEVPIDVVLPSDSDDEDFVDSDNDIEDDDDLYDEWVDKDAEVGGEKKKREKLEDSDYDTDELELPDSDNEDEVREDASQSKSPNKTKKYVKFTHFRPEDMSAPEFRIGMTFADGDLLRKALREYSIRNIIIVKFEKNDKERIRAYCGDPKVKCSWYIFAAPNSSKDFWVVKRYTPEHTCERVWKLKVFTSNYLAKHYLNTFRADMKMTIENFANTVQKDFNMTPSVDKLRRARRLAMQEIHGDEEAQFNKLWDYATEVRRSNLGSSVFIKLKDGHFSSLYFSLYACKKGFMVACRPVICIDGCHIQTKFGGQLFTAVGVDPNDCIFPICMAYVEVEDTKTWLWFLQTLKEDLGISNTAPWTIMSDRQKGLINAVAAEFPDSQHRFCVRHLYHNFNKQFKGHVLKNKLWEIARAYNMIEWKRNMDEMKELNVEAYEYLDAIEPSAWCRAFFSELPKCDLLLNNTCEVFNKYILDARKMPVVSMFEKVKNQVMTRYYTKNEEVDEMGGTVCPKIRKKVAKLVDLSNNYTALPAGKGSYAVGKYQVDILKKECSCRKWQLTGIPCPHGIACLRQNRTSVESVVHDCYNIETFKIAYSEVIKPCRDVTEWQNTNGCAILPPVYTKAVGRPPTKRRRAPEEKDGHLTRHGTIQHCSVCSSTQHNKRKCPDLGRGEIPVPDEVPNAVVEEVVMLSKRKLPVRRFSSSQQAFDDLGAQCSQTSMLDKLLETVAPTQQSQVLPDPLPESSFIASSRDPLPPPRNYVLAKQKKAAADAKKKQEKADAAAKKKKEKADAAAKKKIEKEALAATKKKGK